MSIFDKILYIGPNYKNRGGISTILSLYKENITPFNYLKSSSNKGLLVNMWLLSVLLIKLIGIRCFSKIKILHLHGASYRSFQRKSIIIYIAKFLGFKVIFHCHGGGFKEYVEYKGIEPVKKVLDKCDAIIVLSEFWRKYFKNELGQTKVFIINNMVNRLKTVNNKKDGTLHLLFLGLITEEKGIFDLLEVINQHKHEFKNNNFSLIIGGSGTETDLRRFKNYIKDNELQAYIDYRGWLSEKAKERAFADSNVFILPSYVEGLPISILEAMSNEMPIISTYIGGIPTIVTAKNGILVNPGDKTAVWDAIKGYIDNNNLIYEHGKASGNIVKAFYPESVKEQLTSLYSQL